MNVFVYQFVIFAFMYGLISLVNEIRHIKDDTKNKTECAMIVAWWVLVALVDEILFNMVSSARCTNSTYKYTGTTTTTLSYTVIITRNIVTMFITMYFQFKVREDKIDMKIMTGGQDLRQIIMDFDLLLESIYPHS